MVQPVHFPQVCKPQSLRMLPLSDLPRVAAELRAELISTVQAAGGHFSSNLGTVELTVALHYAFDTPRDRLIWDVGHQAYAHKMLTGRREQLKSIRSEQGLSGFLKPEESEFDCFGAGHAGTSLSAALGMRLALDARGSDAYVTAVIGDGSLTSGMAYEALNHAGSLPLRRLVFVLNDNQMSISENTGALNMLCRTERAGDFFHGLGFEYIGPVDGHEFGELLHALAAAKSAENPVLVHVRTVKGKGFAEAESNPTLWHGITAKKTPPVKTAPPTFTAVFADTLTGLAQRDPSIVAITAAMPTGTGLDVFARQLPERFFDVGICEQHAVTLAAGMAKEGLRPVCAIYSTFLQRAYDQVIHDVCIHNLPVVFAVDRAGAVGNDGETHQGMFDLPALRTVPNLTIFSPKDEFELQQMLCSALERKGPSVIRYPRGSGSGAPLSPAPRPIPFGKAEWVARGEAGAIIALGPLVYRALEARKILWQDFGIRIAVLNARFAKPLDETRIGAALQTYPCICTLEDGSVAGGFGSAVLELAQRVPGRRCNSIKRLGAHDSFLPHAAQERQHELCGYDLASIVDYFRSALIESTSARAAVN